MSLIDAPRTAPRSGPPPPPGSLLQAPLGLTWRYRWAWLGLHAIGLGWVGGRCPLLRNSPFRWVGRRSWITPAGRFFVRRRS